MRHLVPGIQKSRAANFCTKAPSMYGASAWNSLYITHLALRPSKWLLDFCKIVAALNYLTTMIGNMTSKWNGWDVEGSIAVQIWGPGICLEELRKTTKACRTQFWGRDFTRVPLSPALSEYRVGLPTQKFHQDENVTEYNFSCLVAAMESCLMVSKHATTFALLPSECHSGSSVSSQLSFVYANSASGTVQEMSLKVWFF